MQDIKPEFHNILYLIVFLPCLVYAGMTITDKPEERIYNYDFELETSTGPQRFVIAHGLKRDTTTYSTVHYIKLDETNMILDVKPNLKTANDLGTTFYLDGVFHGIVK